MVLAPRSPSGLIDAARAGDAGALSDLIEAHRDMVDRLARYFLRDASEAEDAAQESWLRAIRALKGLDDTARFQPWMKSIVRNVCMTALSRRGHRRLREAAGEAAEAAMDHLADADGPSDQMQARDHQHRVWEALGALSPTDREVLFHHEYRGLSYDDLAQQLGIAPNTAYQRLFRARDRFRKALERTETGRPECGVAALRLSFLLGPPNAIDPALRAHADRCPDCRERLSRMAAGHDLFRRFGGFTMLPMGAFGDLWNRLVALGVRFSGTWTVASGRASAAAVQAAHTAGSDLVPLLATAVVTGGLVLSPSMPEPAPPPVAASAIVEAHRAPPAPASPPAPAASVPHLAPLAFLVGASPQHDVARVGGDAEAARAGIALPGSSSEGFVDADAEDGAPHDARGSGDGPRGLGAPPSARRTIAGVPTHADGTPPVASARVKDSPAAGGTTGAKPDRPGETSPGAGAERGPRDDTRSERTAADLGGSIPGRGDSGPVTSAEAGPSDARTVGRGDDHADARPVHSADGQPNGNAGGPSSADGPRDQGGANAARGEHGHANGGPASANGQANGNAGVGAEGGPPSANAGGSALGGHANGNADGDATGGHANGNAGGWSNADADGGHANGNAGGRSNADADGGHANGNAGGPSNADAAGGPASGNAGGRSNADAGGGHANGNAGGGAGAEAHRAHVG